MLTETKLSNGIWTFIVSLCLYASPLMGDWSSPPAVVYPPSAPYNATYPFMAEDGNGNIIAVWFDVSGSGSMQAATLASGAVNEEGQPLWVLTNPVVTSNVQDPSSPYAQAVGVDSAGNATAVWTDGIYVYAATLAAGHTNWSSPTIINTPISEQVITHPFIAVAVNGNAVVTWISSVHPYDGTIFANVFDAETLTWTGQTNILGVSHVLYNLEAIPVAIDPEGNAVLATTSTTSNAVQAASYNFDANTWTTIPSIATNSIDFSSVAVDSSGNATIVWIQQDHTMHAATLLFNATSLTNPVKLSKSADSTTSAPLVTTDAAGNAVAVWPDASGALATARYSFAEGTWTVLPLLNLGGNEPYIISLSGIANGNVIASWIIYPDPDSYIQTAVLPANKSTWMLLTQISPSSGFANNAKLILTTTGDAVALWENDINSSTGTIDSSIFLNIFSNLTPQPPSSFTGKVLQNKFLTETDRIHQLNWEASPDPSVVEYILYRNSTLLATVAAVGSSFTYEDHDRSKKVSDTYTLVSVNADGYKSSPLSVTLQ